MDNFSGATVFRDHDVPLRGESTQWGICNPSRPRPQATPVPLCVQVPTRCWDSLYRPGVLQFSRPRSLKIKGKAMKLSLHPKVTRAIKVLLSNVLTLVVVSCYSLVVG